MLKDSKNPSNPTSTDINRLLRDVYYSFVIPCQLFFMIAGSAAEISYSFSFVNADTGCNHESAYLKLSPVAWLAIMGTGDLLFSLDSFFVFLLNVEKELSLVLGENVFDVDLDKRSTRKTSEKNRETHGIVMGVLSLLRDKVSESALMRRLDSNSKWSDYANRFYNIFTFFFILFNFGMWVLGANIIWGNNADCAYPSLIISMSFSVVIHLLLTLSYIILLYLRATHRRDEDKPEDIRREMNNVIFRGIANSTKNSDKTLDS